VQLSTEHKPEDEEADRVEDAGGALGCLCWPQVSVHDVCMPHQVPGWVCHSRGEGSLHDMGTLACLLVHLRAVGMRAHAIAVCMKSTRKVLHTPPPPRSLSGLVMERHGQARVAQPGGTKFLAMSRALGDGHFKGQVRNTAMER
jgi:hypothetical protein